MCQALPLFLFDKIDLERIVRLNIFTNLIPQIPDNNRRFRETFLDDLVQDVADNRLTRNIEENFWQRVCMRSESASNAGDRDYCAHELRVMKIFKFCFPIVPPTGFEPVLQA